MVATADGGGGHGLLASLSEQIGAPEAALRLLLSIVAGYPIAAIYRKWIVNQAAKEMHHIFFIVCGLLLCYYNYGLDTYHSLIAICVTHVLTKLLYTAPNQLIVINFIFHMSYLLIGYYFTESNDYDILWTMPHCVLTLRMIGFGFDIADGQKSRDKLSKDQLETALDKQPTLLELMGFAYFPAAFLVGPQFPYRRYKSFINGEYNEHGGAVEAGIKRMLVGVLYLSVRQLGAMWLPDNYFLTPEFSSQSFGMRLLYLGIWAKMSLYKYISCWLLTEGALICIGFSYNGKTEDGKADWHGCSNVKLILLETGNTMSHYVQSFNVNTNQWVAHYVYKRLKFLNNRTISYAAALGFLAVWHGFHSGYYMAFLIEYMIVTTEKEIESFYNSAVVPAYGHVLNTSIPYKCLKFVALKLYNLIYMGWCLTPFIFLSYTRWMHVFSAVNYFGFVYVAIWMIIHKIYKYQLKAAERERKAHTFSTATTLSPTVDNDKKSD